ncbi:MAG: ABC transporter permease [Limisphaerales bacterium]|jgi:putative ABC transport system permease protein
MNWIGLLMLRNDRAKFGAMIVAVALAVFLMQNQAAILSSILLMTASQIRDVEDANLWVTEPDVECFDQAKPVRDIALHQVRGTPGVAWAMPLLKIDTIARTRGGKLSTVSVLGVEDSSLVGLPRRMRLGSAEAIRERDTVLIDPGGFSLLFPGEPPSLGKTLRIHNRTLKVVGISDASPPFTGLPLLHTSRTTAAQLNVGEERSTTFILARSVAGADPIEVCRRIAGRTRLRARTTDGFARDAMWFYGSQGVPMLFMVTIAIGLVVGAAITGQTFLMFVKENARPIAMLKVVGTTHAQLGWMMAAQAGLILFLGSCMGSGLAAVVCEAVRQQPFLRGLYLPSWVALSTCLSLAVVTGGAVFLSFRQVQKLEPASVFR